MPQKLFLYHPLIVHFPIALWLTGALFDILYLRGGERFFLRAAQWLTGLGLLGAGASIVSGFVDYRPLVAEGIGQAFIDIHRTHSVFAYLATLVFLASFVVRRRWSEPPRGAIALLAILGTAAIAAAGWLGGELRNVM